MDINEKETLIRVEQDLKNSIQNHNLIMSELKEIFHRIEKESKLVTTLGSDFKYLKEKVESSEQTLEELIKKIDIEREERIKAVEDEKRNRENFETDIKTGRRLTRWLIIVLGTLGTLLGGIAALLTLLK